MPNPFLLGILGASAANVAGAYLLRETLNSTVMRIMIINGYNCSYLTSKIDEVANNGAGKGTKIFVAYSKEGVGAVDGVYGEENYSVQGILHEYQINHQMDAYIIACFEDTGVEELRASTPTPVIGIGEAAFQMASIISKRFSVIATFPRTIPKIQQNLALYGVGSKCVKVRAAENNGLFDENLYETVSKEIYRSIKEDQVDAIVLGGVPTVGLLKSLTEEHEIPILDGVTCAVKLAESMVSLRQKSTATAANKAQINLTEFATSQDFPSASDEVQQKSKVSKDAPRPKALPSMAIIFGGSAKMNEKLKSESSKFKISMSSLGETEVIRNLKPSDYSDRVGAYSDTSMLAESMQELEKLDLSEEAAKMPKWFLALTCVTYATIFGILVYSLEKWLKNRPGRLPASSNGASLAAGSVILPHKTDAMAILLKCREVAKDGTVKAMEKKLWIRPKPSPIDDLEPTWSEAKIFDDQNGQCKVIIKGFSCK